LPGFKGLSAPLIFLLASVFASSDLRAQATARQKEELSHIDSTRVISIATNDGSTFVGRVVAVRAESIDIQTSVGRVTVAFASMKPLTSIGEPGREGWFENPNETRLFFAPTG
jgi:hypothetical protein